MFVCYILPVKPILGQDILTQFTRNKQAPLAVIISGAGVSPECALPRPAGPPDI